MGAERQLQRAIVLDHLSTICQRTERDVRLDALGAERLRLAIGRGEERLGRFAHATHFP